MLSTLEWTGLTLGSLLIIVGIAFMAAVKIRRAQVAGQMKTTQGYMVVPSKPLYDPRQQIPVAEQIGGDDHLRMPLLLTPSDCIQRSQSEKCLRNIDQVEEGLAAGLLSKQEKCPSMISLKREKWPSMTSLNIDSDDGDIAASPQQFFSLRRSPTVEFCLLWASSTSCLSVTSIRVNSLAPKYLKATCFFSLTLVGPDNKSITKHSEKIRNKFLNLEFTQVFAFTDVTLEDIRQSELVLELNVRRSKHLLNRGVGYLRYHLCVSHILPDSPVMLTKHLTLRKKESAESGIGVPQDTSNGHWDEDHDCWGSLEIKAQHQITRGHHERVKILILKAVSDNSATKGGRGRKVSGEYRVEMVVKRCQETLALHQTKPSAGPNPVWNTPFIFDVAEDKVGEYWIELRVLRCGFVRNTTVGHVFLGNDTTTKGTEHWQAMMAAMHKEITKWHPVILLD